jgi:hypothetical protein
MAIQLSEREINITRIVQAIIQLVQGRNNATGKFSPRLEETTTVVMAVNCSIDSEVFIRPINSNARAEAEATSTYVSSIDQGSFTVTHPSNGDDRQWGYLATGG